MRIAFIEVPTSQSMNQLPQGSRMWLQTSRWPRVIFSAICAAVALSIAVGVSQAGMNSALAQTEPTPIMIDFEGLAPGTNVTEITVDGLTVNVEATGGIGEAWIFDSSSPTGGDEDLGTPNENCSPAGPGQGDGGLPGTIGENCASLGNILIIQENAGGEPDDAATGGTITFTFSEAVIVNFFDLLDFEEATTPSISFFDADGNLLGTPISPVGYGNNSHEQFYPAIDAGVSEVVTSIVMDLPISGAVGGIEVVRASEVMNPGTIGDTITCVDNGAPLPGVLVTLTSAGSQPTTQTTDANGAYLFENLPLGEYTVTVDPSTITGACNIPAVDPDDTLDNMSTVVLTTDVPNNLDQDFAYSEPAPLGSIGDTITCVDNGAPLADVLVTLTSTGNPPVTQTTAQDGTYLFENLPLGEYTVTVDPTTITGTCNIPAVDPDDTLDNTSTVTLTAGAPDNLDQDFAYSEPAPLGSIGDTITCVDNGAPLPGVLVTLTNAGSPPVTQTTATDGTYLFENLPLGEYTVTVDPATITGTCNIPAVDPDDTLDNMSTVTLTAGTPDDLDQDFAYTEPAPQPAPLGSIGDTIFCDANANGSPDAGEGVANVTVTLSGAANDTATTDGNGQYLFTGLVAGNYTITVDSNSLPATCNQATVDPDDTADNMSSIMLAEGEDDLEQDFGYIAPAAPTGSIGDTVFCDANENGQPDAGEGIEGVVISITGPVSATETTDADGNYRFEGLPVGVYTITVDPFSVPAPCNEPAVDPDGGNDNSSTVNLSEGENVPDQNFGFVGTPPVVPDTVTVGNYIWLDADRDGVQGDDESGLPNVQVTLYDGDGTQLDQTTTDPQGEYLFTNLPPGSYSVAVTVPDGYATTESNQGTDDTIDSDIDATNRTDPVEIEEGQNLTLDAGLYQLPPQLTLVKLGPVAPLTRGETIVYTIEYGNIGQGPAEGVVLNEGIPFGTTFDESNSSTGWICTSGADSGCTYEVGRLEAGETNQVVQFAIRISEDLPENVTSISCAVVISSTLPDPNAAATADVLVEITPGAPLSIDIDKEPEMDNHIYLPLLR